MQELWFCRTPTETLGPIRFHELQTAVREGRAGRNDLVRRGWHEPWVPAHQVEGLFDEPPADAAESTPDEPQTLTDLESLPFDVVDFHAAGRPKKPWHPRGTESDTAAAPRSAGPATSRDADASDPAGAPPSGSMSEALDTSEPQDAKTAPAAVWFCRIGGAERGPLSSAQLRQMIADGRLMSWDEVSRDKQPRSWVRVSDVAELSSGAQPRAAHLDRSHAAGDEHASAAHSPAGAGDATSRAAAHQPAAKPAVSAIRPAGAAAARRIRIRRSLAARLRENTDIAAALAVLLALNAAAVLVLIGDPDVDRARYEMYASIWSDLKGLRARDASNAEWEEFAISSAKTLGPVIEDLERSANVNEPIKQNLLWAGRDCLLPMLQDARGTPSRSEQHFADYMAHLRVLFERQAGEP